MIDFLAKPEAENPELPPSEAVATTDSKF